MEAEVDIQLPTAKSSLEALRAAWKYYGSDPRTALGYVCTFAIHNE